MAQAALEQSPSRGKANSATESKEAAKKEPELMTVLNLFFM